MAAALLKRGDAVVWLPPRSAGERAFGSEVRLLALRAGATRAEPVSLDALEGVSQVRLVLDARDVTLLAHPLPPLGAARLAQALPNIVEDALLQDAAACAMVAGPAVDATRRLVAVVDRAWLEFTAGAFERRGMRVRAAWPGQLAVPWAPDRWSMSCTHGGLALRFGENEGLGWTAGDDADFAVEAVVALLQTALAQRPAPAGLAVFVDDEGWREPVERAAARLGLAATVAPLALPETAPVDLLDARAGAGRRWLASFEPRVWRWPAAMAAACLVAWLVGMNLHWAQLAREKDAIRRSLESAFRSAFPSAQVVVDPVLQMNRQVAALRARSGQAGPEDFVPLVARFAQALGPLGVDALAALEYRDGRLKVRFRPQRVDGRAAREQLQDVCRRAGLRLTFDNDREPTATVGLQS